MANGECRTEELWLRYFICKISQVAFTLREKSTLTINVCLRVLDSEDKRNSRFFQLKDVLRFLVLTAYCLRLYIASHKKFRNIALNCSSRNF